MAGQDTALGALIWSMVYAGLAAFFVVSSRLFPRRGYELLGLTLALVSVSGMGMWLLSGRHALPPVLASFGVLLVVGAASFAPSLNTHFLFYYSGRTDGRRWAVAGYVASAGVFLAQLGVTFGFDARGDGAPGWPPPLIAKALVVLFALHLLADMALLVSGIRRGRKRALYPLICVVLLGPVAAYDLLGFTLLAVGSLLAETLVWIYALSVVWGLLAELRGAEGLLKETTSSLAERTAELQVSYAELELVQTELSKKEQLAAVGELAASIAHEVRNPLAIIMNAASGLRRTNLSLPDRETLLSIVDEESERLNKLVSELLRFARPVQAARAPASLADICEKVRSSTPEGYEVQIDTPAGESPASVWVDPGLFRLAIDNLVANAMQSMPEGGVIRLSVCESAFDDGEPAEAISVSDSGEGMTAEEVERARKPFYTTKPRGTGLGLPIVERIVDAHGGQLLIESEKGRGTRVSLLVPIEQVGDARIAASQAPSTRRRRMSTAPPSQPLRVGDGAVLSPSAKTLPRTPRSHTVEEES